MRRNELCGLLWNDVALTAGTVTVHQQLLTLRTVKGQARRTPLFGPTKSNAVPTRVIPINQDTVRLLREHKRQQAEVMMKNRLHYRDFGLVFAKDWRECRKHEDTPGLPLDSNHLGGDPFARLVKAAGVRPITLHGLRHTCATLLMAAGVPVNVVSARLGHAKTSITSDIYAHVLPGMQQEAAAILGTLLAAKSS